MYLGVVDGVGAMKGGGGTRKCLFYMKGVELAVCGLEMFISNGVIYGLPLMVSFKHKLKHLKA